MIAFFALPAGYIVVRLSGSAGKFTGSWGEIESTFDLSAERSK